MSDAARDIWNSLRRPRSLSSFKTVRDVLKSFETVQDCFRLLETLETFQTDRVKTIRDVQLCLNARHSKSFETIWDCSSSVKTIWDRSSLSKTMQDVQNCSRLCEIIQDVRNYSRNSRCLKLFEISETFKIVRACSRPFETTRDTPDLWDRSRCSRSFKTFKIPWDITIWDYLRHSTREGGNMNVLSGRILSKNLSSLIQTRKWSLIWTKKVIFIILRT